MEMESIRDIGAADTANSTEKTEKTENTESVGTEVAGRDHRNAALRSLF